MHANKSIPHIYIFLGVYTIAGEIHFCVHLTPQNNSSRKRKKKKKRLLKIKGRN
jgi:hypothetical protein